MAERTPTSFRLSDECRRLIRDLADRLGLKDAGVIELAIRRMGQTELSGQLASPNPTARARKAPGKGGKRERLETRPGGIADTDEPKARRRRSK